jgi:hypothetical protein
MVTRWLRRGASLTAVLAFLGCGGDGDGPDKFIGTWTHGATTRTATCFGVPQQMQMVTGTFEVQKGTDSALVLVDGATCALKMDVGGDIATVRPNQNCKVSGTGTFGGVSIPFMLDLTILAGQFVVTSAGATFMFSGTGNATATVMQGGAPATVPCNSVAVNGMATKK